MTNIYKDPKKRDMKRRLLEIAIETLQAQGWTVERTTGGASIRTIRKGGESYRISIRTSQDQWIAFPRREDDKAWVTLSSVDVVVVVSVDDLRHPSAARVHWIEADKLRVRFDRAYMARKKAKYSPFSGNSTAAETRTTRFTPALVIAPTRGNRAHYRSAPIRFIGCTRTVLLS